MFSSRRLSELMLLGVFATPTLAASGEFSVLAYNVAGLPELFSSAESDREEAHKIMSCYVNQFDHVNVQEDFNYHSYLYDTCNNHKFRSSTSGGMGIGSGLNTLSHFSYEDFQRVKWDNCNGIDCWTPKGFTLARMRTEEGVFIDMYNLHTQAETGDADLSARRGNINQLVRFINQYSIGNAVIVAGDTNTRYTRSGDNIRELINIGFTDAWVELYRGGDYPASGAGALTCNPKVAAANCEIVDKVLYRSSSYVNLEATLYDIRQDDKNDKGQYLSDHPPVEVRFKYNTAANRKYSDTFGGPHSAYYNDDAVLPSDPVVRSVSLRAGSRVDQIGISLDGGINLNHGGSGGSARTLTLGSDEYVVSLHVCSGKKDGSTRIFFAEFKTNLNRYMSGGSRTSNCKSFVASAGWQLVGYHGRAGKELDKVGVIFAPTSILGGRSNGNDDTTNMAVIGGATVSGIGAAIVAGILIVRRSRQGEGGMVAANSANGEDPFAAFQVNSSKEQEQLEAQE